MAAGAEAYARAGCGRMVLSGGAVQTPVPEADGMAVFARKLGLADAQLALERASRNTWENVGNSLPLLEGYERVYVVSDSLHAYRGLRYLCRRAPERCAKAYPYGYYEPLVRPWGKIRGAWHEVGAYVKYR